jgi:hypothetical protein
MNPESQRTRRNPTRARHEHSLYTHQRPLHCQCPWLQRHLCTDVAAWPPKLDPANCGAAALTSLLIIISEMELHLPLGWESQRSDNIWSDSYQLFMLPPVAGNPRQRRASKRQGVWHIKQRQWRLLCWNWYCYSYGGQITLHCRATGCGRWRWQLIPQGRVTTPRQSGGSRQRTESKGQRRNTVYPEPCPG